MVLAGRYRLESRVAAGAVGEVWRASDTVLDRLVAVKLLRAEYVQHPETLTRFQAEARHASAVSHPGITQVYDYGEDGQPFLVMELVDGPSLAGVLQAGPLEPGSTMDVIAQAAAALDAAHAAGLVHRDIKPANLLIGPGGQVKVTDFGIAHAAGSAPLTRTGMLIGTPAYLAPERVAGRPATPASDLYSLGVVCYECLTGAPPFTGTPIEVALSHQHGVLPPLGADVPAEVTVLVTSLTARDPAARPASAADAARWAAGLRNALTAAASRRLAPPPPPAPPLAPTPPQVPAGPLPATVAGLSAGPLPATVVGLPAGSLPATLGLPAGVAGAPPPTLADIPAVLAGPQAPPGPRPPRRGASRRRSLTLVAAAAAVTAGLAGWLLAGGTTAARPKPHQASPAPASAPPAAPRLAEVNPAALAGLPVTAVRRQLRQLGLRVQVTWVRNGHQQAGTVISVQPAGRLPPGTTVEVTGALAPPGHHGRHGQGDDGGPGG